MISPNFYILVIISPLKRTWPFIWTNLNSLHQNIICNKFDWLWSPGSGEVFKNFQCINFHSFTIISPWRRAIPFVWTNLNSLHPRMICAKSSQNWPIDSGEEIENVKVYRRTTDNGRPDIQLRWAKMWSPRHIFLKSNPFIFVFLIQIVSSSNYEYTCTYLNLWWPIAVA
jgi:hypothetical protein